MKKNAPVSFCGTKYKNKTSLYALVLFPPFGAVQTPRSRRASTEELYRLLTAACELPSEPARTLRLRRMRASVRSSTYYELIADISDNTGKLSRKKACRFAFKP